MLLTEVTKSFPKILNTALPFFCVMRQETNN